jgi:membrane associated rhomboid family serine protease
VNLFLAGLYIIGLYSAYLAGSLYLGMQAANQTRRQVPYATLALTIAIAIPTTLQFFFPSVLQEFERDYIKFLAGDWWRIITPLFVQDGGVSGSIFNLVSLVLVGSVAERLWGSQRWLIIFFAGGILSQIVGFAWQPIGAGNSVANFCLAASIAVLCLAFNGSRAVKLTAILALLTAVILLFLKDIHGPAMLLGILIALILIRLDGDRFQRRP